MANFHRIRRKVDGNFVPSATLILTFDRPSLPDSFHCGFFNLRVQQYVPNPLRYFKCQRLGHTQERCMSHAIYVSCGPKAHSPPCQSSLYCIISNGPHGSNPPYCPKFQMERETQKIMAMDKVSFPEAQHRYQAQHPVDLFQSSSPPVVPPLLRLHDLLTVVFIARLPLPHSILIRIKKYTAS